MVTKICAYCGSVGPFSKEHIWPSCILQKMKGGISYYGKLNKSYKADSQIKDVCESCNNGVLSQLDDYACSIFPALRIEVLKREYRTFKYDYQLLSRWLLKVSYNSARGNDSDIEILKPFSDYILGKSTYCPEFWISVELIRKGIVPNYKELGIPKYISPGLLRSSKLHDPREVYPNLCIRFLAIGSYHFWIFIPKSAVTENGDKKQKIGHLIKPEKNKVKVLASKDAYNVQYDSAMKILQAKV